MVFCYHIGWGTMCPPPHPFLLYLLSNYHQTCHDSSLRQNLLKSVKVKFIVTSLWRLWRHICPVEYRKLLKNSLYIYIKIGAASLSFIWSYSNLAETFSTNTAFDWRRWIWINICFSCSDDVDNIMLAFGWKFCFFDTDYDNYAIVEISTKKKIICDTELINMWIWADEADCFSNFLTITSSWHHNDFIVDIWVQIWD